MEAQLAGEGQTGRRGAGVVSKAEEGGEEVSASGGLVLLGVIMALPLIRRRVREAYLKGIQTARRSRKVAKEATK